MATANHGEFSQVLEKMSISLPFSLRLPWYPYVSAPPVPTIESLDTYAELARASPNISDSLRKHICLRANTTRRVASCRSSLRHQSGTRNVSGTLFALQDNIPRLSKGTREKRERERERGIIASRVARRPLSSLFFGVSSPFYFYLRESADSCHSREMFDCHLFPLSLLSS